MKPTVHQTQIM